jgi:hypothetical protein
MVQPESQVEEGAEASTGDGEISGPKMAAASVSKGGYAEAISRAGYLLAAKGQPLPLAQFELKKKLIAKLGYLLPRLTPEEMRVIRGKQEVICRYEPERAVTTLPLLLSDPVDQEHFFILLDAVVEDYSASFSMTEEQRTMLQRIRKVLSAGQLLKVS